VLIVATWLATGTGPSAEQGQRESEPDGTAAVQTADRPGFAPKPIDGRVIAAWNSLAHDIAFEQDQFLTFKGQRALAMMHLAMHDALNSIVPRYQRYAYAGHVTPGDPIVAAAQAAHDVLLSEYPDQGDRLGAELTAWLSESPQRAARDRAITLGHAAAGAIVALRAGDGWDFPGSYIFRDGPGEYQTTPPWNGFVAQPGFRFARPFVLESPSQFRPEPPPLLAGPDYARALQEVQEFGRLESAHRTADQTAYAVWWMEFAEGSVNRLARQLVTQRDTDLWTAARLFSHIGVALFDTYVATWDSKYEYNHWRPFTAIRTADTDGNQDTIADAQWEPLRPTPPFPEYSSAHAAACAASFGVLAEAFGHDVSFTMATTTAPPDMPTRHFESFAAAAAECADSRVKLGWHFRYSTDAGLVLGQRIARYVMKRALQPSANRGKDR